MFRFIKSREQLARRQVVRSNYFSIPDLSKEFIAFKTPRMHVGVSSCTGYRRFQEDEHISLVEQLLPGNFVDTRYSFFGVFDGHGGRNSAHFLSKALYKNIIRLETNRLSELQSPGTPVPEGELFSSDQILVDAFLQTDRELRTMSHVDHGGSCCITLLVVPRGASVFELICCNVGDSVCVYRDTDGLHALSESHSMRNATEIARVKQAGGHVSSSKRVNGLVNMTRTFGNFSLKKNHAASDSDQILIALPSILRRRVTVTAGEFPYFLLCCDGIVEKGPISASCRLIDELLKAQLTSCYVARRMVRMSDFLSPNVDRFNLSETQIEMNSVATKRSLTENYFQNRLALDLICNDIINESILLRGSCDNHTAILGVFGRNLGKSSLSSRRMERKMYTQQYLPMVAKLLGSSARVFLGSRSSPIDEEVEEPVLRKRRSTGVQARTARKRPRGSSEEDEDEPNRKRRKLADIGCEYCNVM